LALVLEPPALAAAQAVDTVQDATTLAAARALEPRTPTAELRGRVGEWNEQLTELPLIIASDKKHTTRLGNDPELVEPIGRVPRDRWYFAS